MARVLALQKLRYLKNKIEMKYRRVRLLAPALCKCIALLGFAGLGLCLALPLAAQRIAPVNAWTAYPSHNTPKELVKEGDKFYAITKGGLFSYDRLTKETKSYTTVEGLSEVDPTALYRDPRSGKKFIGFGDGMVNVFTDPDAGFDYISDIQRSLLFTAKTINKITSEAELLYIATEFGIVVFDIDRNETRSTVTKIGGNASGVPVKDLMIFGDSLYAAMGTNGVWRAYVDHPNLTLPSAWEEVTGHNGLSRGNAKLLGKTTRANYLAIADTVFTRQDHTGPWVQASMPYQKWSHMKGWDDYFVVQYSTVMRVVEPSGTQFLVFTRGNQYSGYADSSVVMVGDTVNGLSIWLGATDSLEYAFPAGPYNNKVTALAVGNREFYVAPEGKSGASAPAGNTDGFWHFHPEHGWRRFEVEDELSRDSVWAEFARAAYHVADSVCYMGSWNHGIIRLKNGEITDVWTPKNSNLNGGVGNSIRVSALAIDKDKNLWATGIVASNNLNVLRASDNTWHPYSITGMYPIGMVIDDWGNKWINNQALGLTVFNENGTLDVTTDDKVKNLTTEAGRGGLPTNTIYAIAKDLKGQIWVGSLEGIAVFANPGSVFSTTFADASCPVIEGFCLLRDQKVNAIAIDGNNRKWIGTDNGLYLVNPQGNKLLQHFTADNSPLFSNQVVELQIDQQTGEIFIGTSKGLLSLMGEAVGGKEDSDSLYVFPNPVQADYEGLIAITSSFKDVEVKITNSAGRLVRAITALGGQAVWDGKDMSGNRVTPGIYLAMVADKEGKNAGIAKFVILEQTQIR
jgi:FlgD Ig-like domain